MPALPSTFDYRPPPGLDIVHEDDRLIVCNKPSGLLTVPGKDPSLADCLEARVQARYPDRPATKVVHRLDKDTSGLMLVGKSRAAVDALVRAIAAREVNRQYLALAHGTWAGPARRTVEQPIGRDTRNRLRMAVVGEGSGKPARSDFALLAGNAKASLVACKLHTGRTHQIRVHLGWLGHPLVGDAVYGGKPLWGLQRQALHAIHLHLSHPVLGTPLSFWCPPPPDLCDALAEGGLHYNGPPAGQGLIA
jgi:23S rRNA pseudouridine1911/1915/1917 synthase